MVVIVHLKNQSQPIRYDNIENAYEKGSFYCLYREDALVDKYPIADIWRVRETYN